MQGERNGDGDITPISVDLVEINDELLMELREVKHRPSFMAKLWVSYGPFSYATDPMLLHFQP